VAVAKPKQLIIGDVPWMSYHVSVEDTLHNAAKPIRAGVGPECDGQVLVLRDLLGERRWVLLVVGPTKVR
jgi:ketopantoate hydroxymethyltransferase